jgi:PAS domain S-box-containing protein
LPRSETSEGESHEAGQADQDILGALDPVLGDILRRAPSGMSLVDLEGRFLWVNEELCRLAGRPAGELIGQRYVELTHPADRDAVAERFEGLAMGRLETLQGETRFLRPDGSIVWGLTGAIALRLGDAPAAILAETIDVTERRTADREIRAAEERFRTVVGSLAEGVLIVDADGVVVMANDSAVRLLGVPRRELLGRLAADPRWRATDAEGRPLRRDEMPSSRVLRTGEPVRDVLLSVERENDDPLWVTVNAQPLGDEEGETRSAVVSFTDVSAFKRQQDALRAAEERFRRAFEDAPSGMAMTDLDGRYLAVNRALCERLGYEPEEFLTLSFRDVTHDDDVAAQEALDRDILEGRRRTYAMRKRYRHRDGHDVWMEVTVSVLRDQAGRPAQILGQMHDVTAQMREARQAELRHRLALAAGEAGTFEDALDDALRAVCRATGWDVGEAWVPDTAGGLRLVAWWTAHPTDPKLRELREVSEELVLGLGEGIPGSAWARRGVVRTDELRDNVVMPRREISLAAGIRTGLAIPILARGEVVATLCFMAREQDRHHGELVSLVAGAMAQIGSLFERKRAEDALRLSESRLRAIMSSASEAIVMTDEETRIVAWNGAAETMFGWRYGEVLGQPVTMLMPSRYDERQEFSRQRLVGRAEGAVEESTFEAFGLRKSGEEFPIDLSLSTWSDGERRWYGAIVRDISARKAQEDELRRAQAQLQDRAAELERSNADLAQFAYVASHDLSEPLRVVEGYIDLLHRRYAGQLDEHADQFIGHALDGVERMQRLIRDLLAYSRAGQSAAELVEVDVSDLVAGVLTVLDRRIAETRAEVLVGELPRVRANPTQLDQVLQNLLSNALKFADSEAPKVELTSARDVDGWRFAVRDNGPGIPLPDRERVFKMFERLPEQVTAPGSGIGLAICKRIVERRGGRIWVDAAPGGGSVFTFTIPDAVPHEGGR